MWEHMSTKPPIVPLFLAIVSLFTYNGTLGFRFWLHQTKLRGGGGGGGGQASVEIMCADLLKGWFVPTY